MTKHMIVTILALIFIWPVPSHAQFDEYGKIKESITRKLKVLTNYLYDVSVSNVDEEMKSAEKNIRDPYHTLAGRFIFMASTQNIDTINMSGLTGIYEPNTDSILWVSPPLADFSSGMGRLIETRELNNDGQIEIIFGQGKNPVMTEQLWIFSWNGKSGKLITQVDNYGLSTLMELGERYDTKDVDGDGVYEIIGYWYKDENAQTMSNVVYSWNGTLYGNWGHPSSYFRKTKKK